MHEMRTTAPASGISRAALELAREAAPAINELRHRMTLKPPHRQFGSGEVCKSVCPICTQDIFLFLGPGRRTAPEKRRAQLTASGKKFSLSDFFGGRDRTIGAAASSAFRPLMAALVICLGLGLTGCASLQPLSNITGSTDGEHHQIRVEFANSRELPPCTKGGYSK